LFKFEFVKFGVFWYCLQNSECIIFLSGKIGHGFLFGILVFRSSFILSLIVDAL